MSFNIALLTSVIWKQMSLNTYNIGFQITDVKTEFSVILISVIWKPMSLSTYDISFKITDVNITLNRAVNIGYFKTDVVSA